MAAPQQAKGDRVEMMVGRVAKGIGRGLSRTVVVLLASSMLGALEPKIPFAGLAGPLLVSKSGPWITILGILTGLIALRHWLNGRNPATLLLAALAMFAAIASAYVQTRYLDLARRDGLAIDLTRTLWLGDGSHRSPEPQTFVYTSYNGAALPLKIYRPAPGMNAGAAPIIVNVHGGGWVGGTLDLRAPDLRWFADRGYLVIAVEYTLGADNRHLWNVTPAQIACALVWVGNNAPRFGGDISRLAMLGDSAGGNLVLNVPYLANAGHLEPSCPGAVPRVSATIALYPVIDLTRVYHHRDFQMAGFARSMTRTYTGGTPEQFPDRYAYASSFTPINRAAPATLLITGLADHLIRPEPARDFVRDSVRAGIMIHYIEVPYAEHSFDAMPGSIGNQIMRQASLKFLAENGLKPR